jgi:ribosomal protein L7/L12
MLACSHCGAPRETAAANCPFCRVLYGSPAPAGAAPFAPEGMPPEVVAAMKQGNLIEAIRLYRRATKASLLDAKKAVEAMAGRA